MSRKPDATNYQHDPQRLRALVEQSGLTQEEAGRRIGVKPRTMRGYLSLSPTGSGAPYTVLYALEQLAAGDEQNPTH